MQQALHMNSNKLRDLLLASVKTDVKFLINVTSLLFQLGIVFFTNMVGPVALTALKLIIVPILSISRNHQIQAFQELQSSPNKLE